MAIQNTISKPAAPATKNEVTYTANGENVKLSPATVRQYLVSGGGNVTDQEVVMFMSLCRYQHLNPFLREAYLVKYGNSPATMLTGKDVFTKRANRNPRYKGLKAGIIVQDKNTGDVLEREGTFYLPTEDIVGGWAKVFVSGHEDAPSYASVAFSEYAGRKGNGELNSQWATKPATMIRKVALVQALREAFPEDFAAMYAPEEVADVNASALDETPVIVPQTVEPQPAAEAPKAAEVVSSDDPEDVFFN